MAIYTPGLCGCGQPATTEIQCGWHNGPTAHQSGGQYEEMCEACYAETGEAAAHRRQHGILRACEALGIRHGGMVCLDGYGAHLRAAEIRAWIESHPQGA